MKVMVIVKASPSSEAGVMPDADLLAQMTAYNEELVKAGIMLSGEGLKPSKEGFRVRFDGDSRTITQGPFNETSELIAGYWIWEVNSVEHAMEWVAKCPNPMPDASDIEVRPLFEMQDFAEIPGADDALEKEEGMRMHLGMRSASLNAYLFFDGRCEEAMEYYQQHLGANINLMMRFSDSPEPFPEGALPVDYENKIMHAEFTLGTSVIFASDGCGSDGPMRGTSQALTVKNAELAHHAFDALAEGGDIKMPLEKTFWAELYGQVTDKFGVQWMVMVETEQGAIQ
ncbi:YciI family protein [Alteromonas ponticola]|uniref:YciI family protein n=1 Tax=Alteromonas ponticola TaxID=2720613 RepID=A0ABX1R7S5_9ALTE|nr:YciI family protein [Alteromonas ponticola]NMH61288.1 hypothetical protein [Alteromonas ponticola]